MKISCEMREENHGEQRRNGQLLEIVIDRWDIKWWKVVIIQIFCLASINNNHAMQVLVPFHVQLITLLGVRHSPFPTNPHEPLNSTSIHFYFHVDTHKSKYHFYKSYHPFSLASTKGPIFSLPLSTSTTPITVH